MNEILVEVIPLITKTLVTILLLIVSKIVLPEMTGTVIPWLKERRLDSIIRKYVEAAEKMAASGQLSTPKKEYVKMLLSKRGIQVTEDVEASIESAVIELDHAAAQALFLIHESLAPAPMPPEDLQE